MKISYKVPLIATTVILSAFTIFGGYQYKMIEANIYQQTQNNIKEVSGALDAQITQWLNERLKTVAAMAEIIGENTPALPPNKAFMSNVMSNEAFAVNATDYYTVLAVGDGKTISPKEFDLPADWDGRKRPWYQLATRYVKPMLTTPYTDSEDGRLLISAVSQLMINNDFAGVLAADIELSDVSDAVNAINFNNTGYAYLLNDDGEIITYPDKKLYGKNINDIYSSNLTLSASLQDSVIDGQPMLSSFFPLNDFKGSEKTWFIGVNIDKEKALKPARQSALNAMVAALIAAFLASLVFYYFMRFALIKPVNRLTQQSDEISRGKLNTQIYGLERNDEIGELAQAVQRMQKALKMALTKLVATRNQ